MDQDSALQATGAGGGREQRPQEEMAPTAAEAAEETVEAEAATEHEMGDDEEAASDTDEEQLLAGGCGSAEPRPRVLRHCGKGEAPHESMSAGLPIPMLEHPTNLGEQSPEC